MKKILAAFLLVFPLSAPVYARLLPQSNTLNASGTPDAFDVFGNGCPQSAGGSTITGCEVAIDNLGNPQATVANVQTLGTAALPWLNVFSLYHDLTPTTTTQLAALVAPVGSIVLIEESVGGVLVANTYNLCVSTKAAAGDFTYIAVSTSIPAVAGAKCSN